jgi:hypothetical protein
MSSNGFMYLVPGTLAYISDIRGPFVVAYMCNPSYLGGGSRRFKVSGQKVRKILS